MRIVKMGSKIQEQKVLCAHCGTELAYIHEDVKQDMLRQSGEWYFTSYITCPICGDRISLSLRSEYEVRLSEGWYG